MRHGSLRPVQLITLSTAGVFATRDSDENDVVVLSFEAAKQGEDVVAAPLPRAVRPEWARMFVCLLEMAEGVGRERLFASRTTDRIPARTAVYELFRIVFQERPLSHADAVRFAMTRITYFTGLRLEEVEWLPADCLRWTYHEDFLTGVGASDIGGVTWSLRLRYFSVKRRKGRRDLLVEESHPTVPLVQAKRVVQVQE